MNIINDILDFSKIEANKLSLEHIEFHLDEIFDTLANLIVIKAEEKGLEIVFSTDPQVPRHLIGDPYRLNQILTNLANNAIKFTDEGEILLHVEVVEKNGDNVTLRFMIIDSGIGMTEDQINRLFHSFTQADESTTRKFGGTGLGLAICKNLVEMMGGEISVLSKPGKGSTFSFTAKFEVGRGNMVLPELQITNLQDLNVLVVDDNDMSREVLETMLTYMSCHVTTVSSGEKCLRVIEQASGDDKNFDLVLMDWKMQGLDGIETTRLIKQKSSRSRTPAVLMVTAYNLEEIKVKAIENGVDGFLTKPINQSLLFDAIANIVGKKEYRKIPLSQSQIISSVQLSDIAGSTVLLVEDNELNRQVATELLKHTGLLVETANNGQEAVDAVKRKTYDLVFMDIQMPEMDGLEATRIIRDNPANKDLPIVAMTAHAMAGDREKSLEAGMNDHITKPIKPDMLEEALIRWIKPKDQHIRTSLEKLDEEEDVTVPEFSTINIRNGIRNIGGNKRLYKKLLQDFYRDYRTVPADISELITENSMEDARRIAHTIKGVAGNFGAEKLHKTSAELELALKTEDRERVKLLHPPFAVSFQAVMDELSTLGDYSPSQTNPAEKTLDKGKAASLIVRLGTLLDNGDSEAKDLIPTIREHLATPDTADLAEKLIEEIDNYDFEEARSTLTRLQKVMGIELYDA